MSALARHFRPGQTLFKEGEPSKSLFIVKRGTLAIRKMKGDGFIELARVHQNEVVGELAFFDKQPRSATCLALVEVEVLEIAYTDLDKIYKSIPTYLKTIFACVTDRLRKADEVIKRLQKNLISEKEGVVGEKKMDEKTAETHALLQAVNGGSAVDESIKAEIEKDLGETIVEKKTGT